MGRSLLNKKDTEAVNSALDRKGSGFVKIDKKKYIRILSEVYESRYVHFIGKKSVVCLADFEKDGKSGSPDKCPACKKKDDLWEPYNEAKSSGNKTKMKDVLEEIKGVDLKFQMLLTVAVGELKSSDEEDDDGNVKSKIVWEEEPQILPLTEAQYKKLTVSLFENYTFMKTEDDLINRNLIFKKESKEGSKEGSNKGDKYTEVIIVPSKKKTAVPIKFKKADLPDLQEFFNFITKKEMISLLKDQNEDLEDDDLEEDLEEEKEVKKSTKKKSPAKKTKSKNVKEEEDDEDPDFVSKLDEDEDDLDDDLEDDDEDDDYDDFENDE